MLLHEENAAIEWCLVAEMEAMSGSFSYSFFLISCMSLAVLVFESGSVSVGQELVQVMNLLCHRTRLHGCAVLQVEDYRLGFDSVTFLA